MKKIILNITIILCAISGLAASSIEVFEFDNDVQESRYRELIAELRCPKCLNTNLAGSDSAIAVDLRKTVHRLLQEGNSNADILKFLQVRYGNFVLYDPPLIPSTWLLWFGPLLFVVGGGIGLYRFTRSSQVGINLDEQRGEITALLDEVLDEAVEDENS